MKRIKAACLEQTVHFQLKDDLGHAAAARAVKEEYEHYKMQLERSRTRYKIVEETVQPDDSILIKIKKQYNHHDYGDYMLVILLVFTSSIATISANANFKGTLVIVK